MNINQFLDRYSDEAIKKCPTDAHGDKLKTRMLRDGLAMIAESLQGSSSQKKESAPPARKDG